MKYIKSETLVTKVFDYELLIEKQKVTRSIGHHSTSFLEEHRPKAQKVIEKGRAQSKCKTSKALFQTTLF